MAPEEEQLVLAHLEDSKNLAKSICRRRRLPQFIELDDLIGWAWLALINAARKFRPEKNVPFWAYAKRKIEWAIADSLRRKNFAYTSHLPLDSAPERLSDESPFDDAAHEEFLRRVESATHGFTANQRKLFALIFKLDLQQSEAARLLGMSEAAVSQMKGEILIKLRSSREAPILREFMSNIKKSALEENLDLAKLADELGAINLKLEATKADYKRKKEIEALFQAEVKDHPATQPVTFQGRLYEVEISQRKNERKIIPDGMKKIWAFLGAKTFFEHCSMTLKALEVLLKPEQFSEVVTEERTGSRSIETKPMKKSETKLQKAA